MKLSAHFDRAEFACKCQCGFDTVDAELLRILEDVRTHFEQPITINSGCRCWEYNEKVGGKSHSQHLLGRAADIVVQNIPARDVYLFLNRQYPNQLGLGQYETFTHIDTRTGKAARWMG